MLSKVSVKKPYLVLVAIALIIILGVIAFTDIKTDMLPGMNLPYIAVITVYPGAAPEVVERDITNPLEAVLSEVPDIKTGGMTSVSSEHFSLIIIEFLGSADIDKSANLVNEKLRLATLPDSELLQEPLVMKINPSMLPVMSLNVAMEGMTIKESREQLEKVVEEVKSANGVADVSISGLIDDLAYVNIKISSLISTLLDFLQSNLGLDMRINKTMKADMLRRLREEDVQNMTEEDVIDIIIESLQDAENSTGAEFIWLSGAISLLEEAKTDPESELYKFASQLIANKYILSDGADEEFFYSFVDELNVILVNRAIALQLSDMLTIITPELLSQLLFAQDFEVPAGSVSEGVIETVVKVGNGIKTREEFVNMPMLSFNIGAAYSDYFDMMDVALFFLRTYMSSDGVTLVLDEETILSSIAAARLNSALANDPRVKEYFEANTDAEIAEDVTRVLRLLSSIMGDDVVHIPDPSNPEDTKYIVNLAEVQNGLNRMRSTLKVPLLLSSIADVTFFDNSVDSITYMLSRYINGDGELDFVRSGAIILNISKEPDKSTVEITNGVLAKLDGLKATDGMENFTYTVLQNQGDGINLMLDVVMLNLLYGAALAIVILLIFLKSIKATLVVGSSIAISVVFTFVLMYFSGITLNIVSMGGLALGVGMLVDNSIVVLENIYRLRSQGKSVYAAAISGAKQVGGAIVASTVTTMIVFLPIIFRDGLTKAVFTDMALTICFSLFASLIVALTLVPMAASTFMKEKQKKEFKFISKMRDGYAKSLNYFLKRKAVVLILIMVMFAGSIVAVFNMDMVLFPAMPSASMVLTATIDREGLDRYNSKLENPYLTYDDAVSLAMNTIEEVLSGDVLVRKDPLDRLSEIVRYKDNNNAEWVNAIDGVGMYFSAGMSFQGINLGDSAVNANIVLVSEKKRKQSSIEIGKILMGILNRDEVNKGIFKFDVSGGDLMSSLGMGDSSFTINLYGDDAAVLNKAASEFASKFYTVQDGKTVYNIEGITGISRGGGIMSMASAGLTGGNKEYRLVVDKKKASEYGLTVAQVYLQISNALSAQSSIYSLNMKDDEELKNGLVYVYDTNYIVETWYEGKYRDGEGVNIYFKNNVGSGIETTTFYIKNPYENGAFIRTSEGVVFIPVGGEIPITQAANGFGYTLCFEGTDNLPCEKSVLLEKTGTIINYSNDRVRPLNLMKMLIASEDLLGTGAPVEYVELYKILSDESFIKDADGKVITHTDTETLEEVPSGFVRADSYDYIQHTDKRLVLSLSFTYDDSYSQKDIRTKIESKLAENESAFSEENIVHEIIAGNPYVEEVFNDLLFVLGLAIVFIFLVMVAQFQSLKSPFIIMFTIPLAFIGGILAILLAGQAFSVMALMGLIVLVGVVVNNGIVFVDYCNQLIRKGVPLRLALIRTGMDRLRPILMTALTTIVALIVTAADGSEGGAMLQPLAITTIGGMIFSTLLTLYIVPMLYSIFNKNVKQTERDKIAEENAGDDDGLEEWNEEQLEFVATLPGMEEFAPQTAEDIDVVENFESMCREMRETGFPPQTQIESAVTRHFEMLMREMRGKE